MDKKVILVWFRNDLRTIDNEVLEQAVQKADFIIPVYIFDPRYYQTNSFGFQNTGEQRSKFIANAVLSLQNKLKSLGGDLLTFQGLPEDIIPQLVQKYDADEVYHHREVAQKETRISELVEEALWKVKRNLKHFIGHTLYHKEDLPFPIRDIPNDFNTFKKKVIKESSVRPSKPDITKIVIPPHLEKSTFPEEQAAYLIDDIDYGESTALKILEDIVIDTEKNMESYTKLSAYLALGIISPAYTYHFLSSRINSKNKKGLGAFLDNLYLRDYFRFMLKKFPNCYFKSETPVNKNDISIDQWINANTDYKEVNTLLLKLSKEGILSKKERELLALYFIYELKQHWLVGASWFEQQLIDYAPATNYGFWAHISGEGTSSKIFKSEEDWLKINDTLNPE